MTNPGTLYLIATPIGNLQDISFRALAVLKDVAWIAAEDTRHSKKLFVHFNITTPLFSLHAHNEKERSLKILNLLQQGNDIAIVADAGTPLISDPGYLLVKKAHDHGYKVVPIPGPCAAITALSASGLPCERFVFEGFLPTKTTERCQRLTELSDEQRTLIFYEAPHRIKAMLKDAIKILGQGRHGVIAKELTKAFEKIHKAELKELLAWLEEDDKHCKGEFVILISGAKEKAPTTTINIDNDLILATLIKELPLSQAVALTAKITGQTKNFLYRKALTIIS